MSIKAIRYHQFRIFGSIKRLFMTEEEVRISEFIRTAPLYKPIEISVTYKTPNVFQSIPFDYYCKNESCKEFRQFRIESNPPFAQNINQHNNHGPFNVSHPQINGKYSVSQNYKAICTRCKSYGIDIILNVFEKETNKYFLRKVGQYPPYSIEPEKFIAEYLNDTDLDIYKKALICYSQSYGIGMYAYMRRIVETQTLKMITDISALDIPNTEDIKALLEKYNANHQMDSLLNGIYEYLPATLKTLGTNPFKVLHSHLSVGIHSLSDEECLNRAENINTLLKFVIHEIKQEGTAIKTAKEAIKKLLSLQ